jgi:hypothetical protein
VFEGDLRDMRVHAKLVLRLREVMREHCVKRCFFIASALQASVGVRLR